MTTRCWGCTIAPMCAQCKMFERDLDAKMEAARNREFWERERDDDHEREGHMQDLCDIMDRRNGDE